MGCEVIRPRTGSKKKKKNLKAGEKEAECSETSKYVFGRISSYLDFFVSKSYILDRKIIIEKNKNMVSAKKGFCLFHLYEYMINMITILANLLQQKVLNVQ